MDVFRYPIILFPEERRTLSASMIAGECRIKIPAQVLRKKQKIIDLVDSIYWKLLMKTDERFLQERVASLNERFFRLPYRQIRYHRQFRRWGSCSSLKNINISHRLIGAPVDLTDYVICHELAHLEHLNHSRKFWEFLSVSGCDPKRARQELAVYGEFWFRQYILWRRSLPDIIKLGSAFSQPISKKDIRHQIHR